MPGKKILIVDDDGGVRELVSKLLDKKGYDVSTAGDGASARRAILTEKPDLILMDIMLPDTHGSDIIAEIRQDPALPEIPVIFLSAIADTADAEITAAGKRYPALAKPLKSAQLLEQVQAALSNK